MRQLNVGLLVCLAATTSVYAEESADPQDVPTGALTTFRDQIAPMLSARCVTCHGANEQESGLRLDSSAGMAAGGDRGALLERDEPKSSWLYRALDPQDDELVMPPDGPPATAAELQAVRDWISAGAVWPEDISQLSAATAQITEEDRAFWSFMPPQRFEPPQVLDDNWSRNDVDRFIVEQMRQSNVQPLPEADRATLARRLYYDILGLPPTPDELQGFLSDDAPDAYERLVDALLDRPEYGQRWARFWLDLVRYAESDGFKADVYRPRAWLYRDYVVRAFNDDKPYDRFIQEQLAGDELYPDDPQARIATGYLRLWPLEDNQKDVQRQWRLVLHDVTEVTSEAVMGIGIRCARCHDHKYDPIPQRDYYRLQAFFASMLPRDDLSIPRHEAMTSLRSWEDTTRPIRRAMRRMEMEHVASRQKTIEAYPPYLQDMYQRPIDSWTPRDHQLAYLSRPQIEKKAAEEIEFQGNLKTRWSELTQQLKEHEPVRPDDVVPVMAVTDVGQQAPPTYLANNEQLDEVPPGFLSVLDPSDAEMVSLEAPRGSTGRRATLAKWLTESDHPLTSRVIVNRIWQQHFGRGLVATANDFGRQGTPPTHPELLDYLACRFVDDGWSMKSLHRLLLNSATYRQQAYQGPQQSGVGPDVAARTYVGRLPMRLDGDQIRDAMLAVAGQLRPYESAPAVDGRQPVRSIQVKQVRNRPDEWLNAFDGPDMFNSCARRFVTTTPIQSLLVANSPWAQERAAAFASRVASHASPDTDTWVVQVYQAAFSRQPEEAELELAREFFAGGTAETPTVEQLADFCHVIMCSNEFVYID